MLFLVLVTYQLGLYYVSAVCLLAEIVVLLCFLNTLFFAISRQLLVSVQYAQSINQVVNCNVINLYSSWTHESYLFRMMI